ncbi:H-NS histone family protein [Sedimentitalea todarodis]|uniref:H-NS histone family protein n=1 Tax=Sedimentitalea todarodis TaxID=1631240 RepID=A0ABU3VLJ8_9RHOB|nr:H-NS histone family protein [Sedimentitalea todarodis]MDU9007071.1 H-NS histone family protein [Sedimentitalea todarodis]
MAKINLNKLSLKELQALEKDIAKAIVSFEQNRRKEALVAVEAKAKEFGFSLSELTANREKQQAASAPKYRHPDEPTLTWSGRGRRPTWFVEAVEGGMSPEAMLIT